jgi:hypothetical protein
MDVFVCNHTQDNRQSAHQIAQGVVALLRPLAPHIQAIDRGIPTAHISAQSAPQV